MMAPIQLSREKAAKDPGVRWDAMNEFCAFADLKDLTPVQRVACLACDYSSTVTMADHHEYFSRMPHPDHDEVTAALRAIGATEQAAILSAARSAVAAASRRAPEEYENRYLAGVEFADLIEFDESFERCATSIPACLMDYLDKHESEFIEWKP